MEIKVQIPLQELLSAVKDLSLEEKNQLKKALAESSLAPKKTMGLKDLLLRGPVYSEEQIKTIEDNRKSLAEWRTKD